MNKVILIGNLTRDPETRTTPAGVSVCTFSIAVNRRYANANGVREADFINIVTWRQLADTCSRFLQKGRKVGIVGSIQTRTYDAQDGSKRYVTEVVADEVEFLNSGNGNGSAPAGDSFSGMPVPPEAPAARSSAPVNTVLSEADDDELPF